MSTLSTCFYPPQFRMEHLERLVAFEAPAETGSQIWNEVHAEVQRVLTGLDDVVRLRVPCLHVASGRTQGRSFYLFTYLTFSRTDATGIDPVVVGLTFARADDEEEQVVIDADVSGEQTGDGIESIARRTVPVAREELLRASHELAQGLSCFGQRIAEALLDSSRSA
jgi:hypothetical protein